MDSQSAEEDFEELVDYQESYDSELLDDEILVCECFCVNVSDIRQLFEEEKAVDLEALKKTYSLGEGCKSCLKNQRFWVSKIF